MHKDLCTSDVYAADRSNLENLTIKMYTFWQIPMSIKLRELADLIFEVIFASTGRPVFCANHLFLWMNFCTCAVTVYMKK